MVGGPGVGMGGREGGLMSAGNSVEMEGGFSSISDGGGSLGAFCALIAARGGKRRL